MIRTLTILGCLASAPIISYMIVQRLQSQVEINRETLSNLLHDKLPMRHPSSECFSAANKVLFRLKEIPALYHEDKKERYSWLTDHWQNPTKRLVLEGFQKPCLDMRASARQKLEGMEKAIVFYKQLALPVLVVSFIGSVLFLIPRFPLLELAP